jgi:hypothetical protein
MSLIFHFVLRLMCSRLTERRTACSCPLWNKLSDLHSLLKIIKIALLISVCTDMDILHLFLSAVHGTCVNNGAYFKLLEACRIQLSSLSHGTPDVNGRSRHHSFCRLLASHHREEGEEEEERDNLERVTLWHKT